MKNQVIPAFNIIGIEIRTTNENGQSGQDIPALWQRFMAEGVLQKIPNKVDDTLYCMYTNYEKDHTKPYSTILGCKVSSLDFIPEGMSGKRVEEAHYSIVTAKGNIMEGMVFAEWVKIWNSTLSRTFTADYEVYGEKAQNLENAEVDIYLATNP